MTLHDLYRLCDNLTHLSYLKIMHDGELICDCKYAELHPQWWERRIKGFKIIDELNIEIYM